MNWGDFRASLRETLLKDDIADEETGDFRWSDAELLTYFSWAIRTFASHTAAASATTITPALVQNALPENIFDGDEFDSTSRVLYQPSVGSDLEFLNPVRYTDYINEEDGRGFDTVFPSILTLSFTPLTTSTLYIRYFAYWPEPVADGDVLAVPRWALQPLSYLTAAHAINGFSTRTANIRQYGAKPDTGNPEHNPLIKQAEWFMKLYEAELRKYPVQDRAQHHRHGS